MNKNPPDLSILSLTSADRDRGHGRNSGQPDAAMAGPVGIPPRPGQVVLGDIGMHIDRHGTWHYRGSSIERQELVTLFSSVLRRDDAGDHWLITPAEMARVSVEDAAYMVVDLLIEGEGSDQTIRFRTNIDAEVTLDAAHPLRVAVDAGDQSPAPYVTLDHGLEAKLSRAVFYDLVALGVEEKIKDEQILGVWSDGDFFPMGVLPPEDE